MQTEAIVYLLRKTSLTRSEIGKLKPDQLNAIVKEVYFQESVENYREQYSVASILAAIYNTIPRKQGSKVFTPKDFLPEREQTISGETKSHLEILAKQKGILLPSS